MTIGSALIFFIIIGSFYSFAVREWKRTQRDFYRNELFSLRDDLREYFYVNNLDMNSRIYKNTRDLINSHLRFMDFFSFAHIQINMDIREKYPKEYKELIHENELRFKTNNPKLQIFINDIRNSASYNLKRYAIDKDYKTWIAARIIKSLILISAKFEEYYMRSKFSIMTKEPTNSIETISIQRDTIDELKYSLV
jgi:hypothetical protein